MAIYIHFFFCHLAFLAPGSETLDLLGYEGLIPPGVWAHFFPFHVLVEEIFVMGTCGYSHFGHGYEYRKTTVGGYVSLRKIHDLLPTTGITELLCLGEQK
jgi:hypothetical protein